MFCCKKKGMIPSSVCEKVPNALLSQKKVLSSISTLKSQLSLNGHKIIFAFLDKRAYTKGYHQKKRKDI